MQRHKYTHTHEQTIKKTPKERERDAHMHKNK